MTKRPKRRGGSRKRSTKSKGRSPFRPIEASYYDQSEFIPRIIGIQSDGQLTCFGTCFVCTSLLVVIAKHVLDQFISSDPTASEMIKTEHRITFENEIWIIQNINKNGVFHHYNVWYPKELYLVRNSDIAVMSLIPKCVNAAKYVDWKAPPISLVPPQVGSKVTAFGNHDVHFEGSRWDDSGKVDHISVNATDSVSDGRVLEVFPYMRDPTLMPYPCFRTNARLEPGMSGGPVINEKSEIIGLATRGWDFEEGEDTHESYMSLLWPLMTAMIDFDQFGVSPIRGRKPLIDLARTDILPVRGLEHIVEDHSNGGRRFIYKP